MVGTRLCVLEKGSGQGGLTFHTNEPGHCLQGQVSLTVLVCLIESGILSCPELTALFRKPNGSLHKGLPCMSSLKSPAHVRCAVAASPSRRLSGALLCTSTRGPACCRRWCRVEIKITRAFPSRCRGYRLEVLFHWDTRLS